MRRSVAQDASLRRHHLFLIAVAITGLAASMAGYQWAEQHRIQTHRDRIAQAARTAASNLEQQVRLASGIVESLAGFVENSVEVSPEEFSAFVERASDKCPSLLAAGFQAYLRDDERREFEAAQRAAGRPGFEIVDSSSPGVTRRAPVREYYVPITLHHVLRGQLPPLGLDLQAYAQFMDPKWLALEQAQPAASRLIPCAIGPAPEDRNRPGFVVNSAVRRPGEGSARERLRGFASITLLVEPLLRAALANVDIDGLRISIHDSMTVSASLGLEIAGPDARATGATGLAAETHAIRLPGHTWTMVVTPTQGALRGPIEWLPAFVLLAGFAFTIVASLTAARAGRARRFREQMDRERRAAERKFHEVVENMAGAVTVFGAGRDGASFSVWDINAAAAALVHEDCDQIIGCSLAHVYGPEIHGALHEAMRRVWASGLSEKLPPFPLTRSGRVRWFSTNVFKLGSGEIVTVCTDVTAQKEVEEELRQARAELEMTLEASRVGLWSWELPLQSVRVDPRTADILDIGATEMLSESDLRERIHVEDMDRLAREVKHALDAGREFEAEIRWSIRDGSWRRLCLRARAVTAESGGPRIVGCVWDATQRRLQEETQQHQQRMDSISTLAGGIAHDLNNALAPLTMGLDLLRLRMGRDDVELVETIQAMSSSTRKAAAVVKQLSGLARGSADLIATCNPSTVLDTFRRQLREAFPPGIGVHVSAPAEKFPLVQISGRQLHQAIQSLCINAREAMRGSGTLTLDARSLQVDESNRARYPELAAGAYILFAVRDTGPGMPREVRERIFDPFFTTKEPGRGTGLGLPTALAIVRSAGGTIHVETEVGGGSCFSVVVPVARDLAAKPSSVPASDGAAVVLRGRRVLLADDDVMVREVARRVLERAGMSVQLAADGREAVAHFQQQPQGFDIVVLDMVMPEMDGATAGAAIRALRAEVPILGASGYAAEKILAQARAAGFTTFLPKPYTMDSLVNAVRDALAPQLTRV